MTYHIICSNILKMSSEQFVQQYNDLKVIKVVFQERWHGQLDEKARLDDEDWQITEILPSDWRFDYLSYCVWLATSWLCTKKCVNVMADIAYETNKQNIKGNRPLKFPDDKEKAKEWVETTFLKGVIDSFPAVYIDYQLTDDRLWGCHSRVWDESKYHQFCNVYICAYQIEGLLNCIADKDVKLTHRWLLRLAVTLLHEVGGHVLVSKVTEGSEGTPEFLTAYEDTAIAERDLPEDQKTVRISEAGDVVERGVLGGTLFMLDYLNDSPHHPGRPSLQREHHAHAKLSSPRIKDEDVAKLLRRGT